MGHWLPSGEGGCSASPRCRQWVGRCWVTALELALASLLGRPWCRHRCHSRWGQTMTLGTPRPRAVLHRRTHPLPRRPARRPPTPPRPRARVPRLHQLLPDWQAQRPPLVPALLLAMSVPPLGRVGWACRGLDPHPLQQSARRLPCRPAWPRGHQKGPHLRPAAVLAPESVPWTGRLRRRQRQRRRRRPLCRGPRSQHLPPCRAP